MWKVRTSNSLNSTIIFLVHPPTYISERIKTSQIKSKSEWINVDKELEKKRSKTLKNTNSGKSE